MTTPLTNMDIRLPYAVRMVPQVGLNRAVISGSNQSGEYYALSAGTYQLSASYDGPGGVQLQFLNGNAPRTVITTVPSGTAGVPRRSTPVEVTVTMGARVCFAIVPPPSATDAQNYRGSITVIPSQNAA